MKNKLITATCLAGIACAWAYVHGQAGTRPILQSGSNGRYQVISADIDAEGLGGNLKHKTSIRIDTETGDTWSLDEIDSSTGGGNFYWVKLQEAK